MISAGMLTCTGGAMAQVEAPAKADGEEKKREKLLMPALDKAWQGEDYITFVNKLTQKGKDPVMLTFFYMSADKGVYIKKLTNAENLTHISDKDIPIQDRMKSFAAMTAAMATTQTLIGKVGDKEKKLYVSENIAVDSFELRLSTKGVSLMDEVIKKFINDKNKEKLPSLRQNQRLCVIRLRQILRREWKHNTPNDINVLLDAIHASLPEVVKVMTAEEKKGCLEKLLITKHGVELTEAQKKKVEEIEKLLKE